MQSKGRVLKNLFIPGVSGYNFARNIKGPN